MTNKQLRRARLRTAEKLARAAYDYSTDSLRYKIDDPTIARALIDLAGHMHRIANTVTGRGC